MSGDPIGELYPSLPNDELQMAREDLELYIALAWEIYEESRALLQRRLDGPPVPGQDSEERSIPQTS